MPAREWVAVYYDNPEEVPAENCAARQRSPWMRIMSFPPTAKGDPAAIAGGDYACARARVVEYDFATPWMQFSTACSRARRIASPPALL